MFEWLAYWMGGYLFSFLIRHKIMKMIWIMFSCDGLLIRKRRGLSFRAMEGR